MEQQRRLPGMVLIFFMSISSFAQEMSSFEFKPVQQLKRQHGLQDPFLKPDKTRVASKNEWEKQRQYIKSMLAHYQYGEMPHSPDDAVIIETLSEEIYDGSAEKKLYTLTLKHSPVH